MDTDFNEYVRQHITEYLPDRYKDSEVFLEIVMQDSTDIRPAVIIPDANEDIGPRIYLDDIAREVREGRDLDEAMRDIAQQRVIAEFASRRSSREDRCYENVRPTLSTRMCDIRYNERYLLDKPWTKYGPFAVYYRFRKQADNPDSAAPVTHELLNSWGVSARQLHEDAFEAERQPHFLHDAEKSADIYFQHTDAVRFESKSHA